MQKLLQFLAHKFNFEWWSFSFHFKILNLVWIRLWTWHGIPKAKNSNILKAHISKNEIINEFDPFYAILQEFEYKVFSSSNFQCIKASIVTFFYRWMMTSFDVSDVIWRQMTSFIVIWRHLTSMTSYDVIWLFEKYFLFFFKSK